MKKRIAVVMLMAALAVGGCGKSRKEREEEVARIEQQHQQEIARQARVETEQREAAARAAESSAMEKQRQEDAATIIRLESYVRSGLKDPQSAQFADVRLNASKDALCGRVNAKNGFGGYVGFVDFVATDSGPVQGVHAYLRSDTDLIGLLYDDVAKKSGCLN